MFRACLKALKQGVKYLYFVIENASHHIITFHRMFIHDVLLFWLSISRNCTIFQNNFAYIQLEQITELIYNDPKQN